MLKRNFCKMNSECQLPVNKKLMNITKMEFDIVIDENLEITNYKYMYY